MVKKISALFMCVCLVASCFVACSSEDESTEPAGGLGDSVVEYGFETDEDGNTVAVIYEDGKAYVLDAEGKKTGKIISDPQNIPEANHSSEDTDNDQQNQKGPDNVGDREDVGNNTGGSPGTTSSELTTLPISEDRVPSTSADGERVQFSDNDVTTVTNMLEVPYLYLADYENTDNVPIEIATHVACWMLQRENMDMNTFASNTVVIDLFNYFARTVVSFKTKCNSYTSEDIADAAPISYNSSKDTFSITSGSYEAHTHTVNITQIQDLGNNNYYKVIADVSPINKNCDKKQVIAVIQKNKLDTSLGFSIKALKWS